MYVEEEKRTVVHKDLPNSARETVTTVLFQHSREVVYVRDLIMLIWSTFCALQIRLRDIHSSMGLLKTLSTRKWLDDG